MGQASWGADRGQAWFGGPGAWGGRGLGERERGAGTVWVVAVMALIWFMAVALLLMGTARIARHRAEAAADLSALAGATQALAAPETACRRARDLAAANHASMTRCVVREGVVDVRVKVRLVLPWLGERSTFADSRAGPR
ncbi:Rv3654c family TadE-like protein [Sphaerisporangium perillae]|uniref:Rv3654c family TadE-like protein n=1 Tax=Sphaerisporangium perillae TaxID=2935860 RepID=UPI0027E08415|nr:Rv3654c family TadE-like protein [Sphaerisporangium perillae]